MPTYVDTGRQRATTLTIQPMNNGVPVGSLITEYLYNQFTLNATTYPTLTVDELRRLPNADYDDRCTAFISWVKEQHAADMPGLGNPTNTSVIG